MTVAPTEPTNPPDPKETPDQKYLRLLRESGWSVTDQDQIIRVAHAECAMFAEGKSGVDITQEVEQKYNITWEAANSQVSAAQVIYCRQYLGQ